MSKDNLKGKWVVEWSEIQQEFHVDTLEITLDRNMRAFFSDRPSQYVILCIAEDQEQAHQLCGQLRAEKFGEDTE